MIAVRGMPLPQATVLHACVTGDPIVASAGVSPSPVDPARHVVTGFLAGNVPFTVGSLNDWLRRTRARGIPPTPIARARHEHLLIVASVLLHDHDSPMIDTLTGLAMVYTLLEAAASSVAAAYAERARAAHLGIGGP